MIKEAGKPRMAWCGAYFLIILRDVTKLLLIPALVLLLSISLSAQTTNQSVCPSITVNGPPGVVNPGDIVVYEALVSGDFPSEITYVWTVVGFRIASGQGTSSITVRLPMNPPYVITASVEIGGLPEGCLRTASETFAEEAGPPQAIKLGVVNGIHHQIHDNLLTKIENNLRDQSNDQLFLVLHFNKNATQITVDHTKKNLLRRLMTRKINPARVVFITTSDGQRRGIVWLVPPGANRPQP